MSETVIRVSNVSKRYRIGERERYLALRDILAKSMSAPLQRFLGGNGKPRENKESPHMWALKDVSFEVKRGEVVGIIGRNGAGKSTLLKILSRITRPTSGHAEINGRVGSLLEVGTGFHPELTGRENIYLNGAILGMRKAEIRRKFDEIVAFAEVEKFLDTPVKRYSSGMYVRLAFSVAAHLESEVLLVDEVLAVGDVAFQKKCLGKMRRVAGAGRTILFVSHNMAAIETLCDKGIVLSKGGKEYDGVSVGAVAAYLSSNITDDRCELESHRRSIRLSKEVEFLDIRFEKTPQTFTTHEEIRFLARLYGNRDVDLFRISITVFTQNGSPVGSTFGKDSLSIRKAQSILVSATIPQHGLAPGLYYMGIAAGTGNHQTGHRDFDVLHEVLPFEIKLQGKHEGTMATWTKGWGAIIFPELILEKQ